MINLIGKIQIAIGTTTERMSVVPLLSEPVFDTDEKRLYIGDGTTYGGVGVGSSAQVTDLQNQIDQLVTDLTNEISNRTTADSTLQTNIDSANQAIQDEINARIAADSDLQGKIDAINTSISTINGQITTLTTDLSTETTNRTNADTTLQGNIDTVSGDLSTLTTTVDNHIADTANPHGVTKAQVGLANVDNTSDLNKPISTAQQTALDLKANDADLATVAKTGSYNDLSNKPTITDQVNSDWNATTGKAEILNKPTTVAGYGITDAVTTDKVGSANGVAALGSDGKVPSTQLPALALTDVYTVASEAEMIALVAQEGDIAVRTDISKTFIHNGGSVGDATDWTEMLSPTASVISVNSKTGAVVLDKTDIGLDQIDNTSDLNKPVSTAQQAAIDAKADKTYVDTQDTTIQGNLDTHIADTANPHGVTKAQVGLGNVDNTSDLNKPISTATQTALDGKASTTALSTETTNRTNADSAIQSDLTSHKNNTLNPHSVTKAQVGLANVDNTSDLNKPISTATQTALDTKASVTALNTESTTRFNNDNTLQSNIDTVSGDLSTHVNDTTNPHGVTKAQIGLDQVDNTADINKPVSTAQQTALNAKQDKFGTQVANEVYASPNGATGSPSFRTLVAADIPALPYASDNVTITAGTGLAGGGDLSANRTLSLSTATQASLAKADSALQSADIGTTVQAYDATLDSWALIDPTTKVDTSAIGTAASHAATDFEPSFSKGNLIVGTGVNLTGTLANRLVGTGDVTIALDAKFTDLNDVPSSYVGNAGKFTKVNATEDGLTFATISLTDVTGTADDITEGASHLFLSSAERTKLAGIADGATSNTGTVTSIDFTTSTGLTATGGPVTSSGTVNLALSSNLQSWSGIAPSSKIDASEKGAANGVASLGSDGKIPSAQLPALALTEVYTVSSDAAQTALVAQEGDVAIRTDLSKSYVHNGGTAGDMTDWTELLSPQGTGAVSSVNGKTGTVVLDKTDIGLANVDNTSDLNKPISTATQTALDGKQAAFGSQTANFVYAAPNGTAGTPTFRGLVAADIPSLPYVANTRNVTAGDGLTGGGVLSGDITLALSTSTITSLGKADTALQSTDIGVTIQGYSSNLAAWSNLATSSKVSTGAMTSSGLTMATSRLLGRTTSATGAVEEISVGSGLSLVGGVLNTVNNGTVTSVAATGSTGITASNTGTSAISISLTLSANLQSWSGITPSSKADASSLSNYLLKTGGTLTGDLQGTTATFSGDTITPLQAFILNVNGTFSTAALNRIIMKQSSAAVTWTISDSIAVRTGDVITLTNGNAAGNITLAKSGTITAFFQGGTSVTTMTVAPYTSLTIVHVGNGVWIA